MVVDDEEKANILNTFFSTVFTVENEMLGEIPRNNENPILRVTNLTQEEVRNRLNKIKIDKSPGPDGIHPRVLRELSNVIDKPLFLIFSDSIATGSVPQDWRIANVVPIFKKGSKSEPGNYRPHGFMRNRSCQTNLISFYEEVSYRLDHGESLDVVYLDFSKAFDTVPHKSQCRWTIISSANIKIRFVKLDLEDHVTCAHDSLIFTVKQKEVRKLCGYVLPSPLIIRSGNVTVSFISDGSVSGRGFEFEFSTLSPTSKKGSGCGSAAELREEGKIFTLNYPGLYPSNTSCRWVIEAPEGNVIQSLYVGFSWIMSSSVLVTLWSLNSKVITREITLVLRQGSALYIQVCVHDRLHFADGQTGVKSIQAPPAPNQESKGLHIGVCGVAPLPPQWLLSRIVGGEESCPNCWPWQVAIMYEDTFLCGGVVVTPQWALTAAHCKVSSDVSQYRLIAGIHDRLLNESSRQVRMVHVFAAHEMYSPITRDYDLALIRLAEELTFNDFVRPVCLPSMEEPLQPSSLCVVTGWGSTREDGQYSNRLQQLPVPILNNTICNSNYYPGAISDNMFCAGFPGSEGKDACQGDSGGPLVCPRSNKTYVLYGIVSWGVGCARPKRPGVYTRVRSFLSWIENTQKGNWIAWTMASVQEKTNMNINFSVYTEVNKTLHHPNIPVKKPMSPEGQRFLPAGKLDKNDKVYYLYASLKCISEI
ncbi:unnamed protein product [Ranitomeya imitator]|uniref:Ovochymase-1 n=1 Tax=Ranitomeya imitator TaxID=111125 RepID=A0ABN9MD76_9NEOB|nr:unnamed protein product [Ranitomeya imitator]